MLAQGQQLYDLLPQRPPMVMVDTLISCNDKQTITSLKVEDDNIFVSGNKLSMPGLVENIAQTAAVRTGWMAHQTSDAEKINIPLGVIGAIKNLEIHDYPHSGSILETRVEVLYEFGNASIIKGSVSSSQKQYAVCEMKIFLQNS